MGFEIIQEFFRSFTKPFYWHLLFVCVFFIIVICIQAGTQKWETVGPYILNILGGVVSSSVVVVFTLGFAREATEEN